MDRFFEVLLYFKVIYSGKYQRHLKLTLNLVQVLIRILISDINSSIPGWDGGLPRTGSANQDVCVHLSHMWLENAALNN